MNYQLILKQKIIVLSLKKRIIKDERVIIITIRVYLIPLITNFLFFFDNYLHLRQ